MAIRRVPVTGRMTAVTASARAPGSNASRQEKPLSCARGGRGARGRAGDQHPRQHGDRQTPVRRARIVSSQGLNSRGGRKVAPRDRHLGLPDAGHQRVRTAVRGRPAWCPHGQLQPSVGRRTSRTRDRRPSRLTLRTRVPTGMVTPSPTVAAIDGAERPWSCSVARSRAANTFTKPAPSRMSDPRHWVDRAAPEAPRRARRRAGTDARRAVDGPLARPFRSYPRPASPASGTSSSGRCWPRSPRRGRRWARRGRSPASRRAVRRGCHRGRLGEHGLGVGVRVALLRPAPSRP